MHTTNSLLNAYRKHLCISSDKALALKLGVTAQRINQYRRGDSCLCDDRTITIAKALGLNTEEVLLQIWAERAEKAHHEMTFSQVTAILRRLGVAIA